MHFYVYCTLFSIYIALLPSHRLVSEFIPIAVLSLCCHHPDWCRNSSVLQCCRSVAITPTAWCRNSPLLQCCRSVAIIPIGVVIHHYCSVVALLPLLRLVSEFTAIAVLSLCCHHPDWPRNSPLLQCSRSVVITLTGRSACCRCHECSFKSNSSKLFFDLIPIALCLEYANHIMKVFKLHFIINGIFP